MVLSRVWPALVLLVSLTAGTALLWPPPAAAITAAPTGITRVENAAATRLGWLTGRGHGGLMPPKLAIHPCQRPAVPAGWVRRLSPARQHAWARLAAQPCHRGGVRHRTVTPPTPVVTVRAHAPEHPAPRAETPAPQVVAVADLAPATGADPNAATTRTGAGDPPPPGDEPAPWGPGTPDWDKRRVLT